MGSHAEFGRNGYRSMSGSYVLVGIIRSVPYEMSASWWQILWE
ncbi:hypothetical protein [Listeria cornellensis]|nr:hypothetical protein [Listeria cornellensis]